MMSNITDQQLDEIGREMRLQLEIRNRHYLRKLYKNCFVGSEAVNWLVDRGFVSTREEGELIGDRMFKKKLLRHVTDGHQFKDAYYFYRWREDEDDIAELGTTHAGHIVLKKDDNDKNNDNNNNDNQFTQSLGAGGNRWSFAPHTAHNSLVLNLALAKELEMVCSGTDQNAKKKVIEVLRQNVRNAASIDDPEWKLVKKTNKNGTEVKIFKRKRPRGEFTTTRTEGIVGISPKEFVKGLLDFNLRKNWEELFKDGVVVEEIDIGEDNPYFGEFNENLNDENRNALPKTSEWKNVDIANIPEGLPIARFDDPILQQAISYLKDQMLRSHPQMCMRCSTNFSRPGEVRLCPCCGIVACSLCVSKIVYDVIAKREEKVCNHCFRESTRILHPPEESENFPEGHKGRWWHPHQILINKSNEKDNNEINDDNVIDENLKKLNLRQDNLHIKDDDDDDDDDDDILEDESSMKINNIKQKRSSYLNDAASSWDRSVEEINEETKNENNNNNIDNNNNNNDDEKKNDNLNSTEIKKIRKKWAKCKHCGQKVERSMEAMEYHSTTCQDTLRATGLLNDEGRDSLSDTKNSLGGVTRHDFRKNNTSKIIYRVSESPNSLLWPREVCAFQDAFIDPNGIAYSYEISVRHADVQGTTGHVTAEVLLLAHVARPLQFSENSSYVSIITQMNSKASVPNWVASVMASGSRFGFHTGLDILSELNPSETPKLVNTSNNNNSKKQLSTINENDDDDNNNNNKNNNEIKDGEDAKNNVEMKQKVTMKDFELLAVLGRGGFGKVMQVRHKSTGNIYAMKILKKKELKRRKQIERTQTERNILAAIRNPFIVNLAFAFQNSAKLYMVMDFVQGGDFFTLLRKFKRLDANWVRLYSAEIAIALDALHQNDIVYRDLKPENVLLARDGHVKLTDFGLSRYYETRPPLPQDVMEDGGKAEHITRSFCGTEQYMAPEMLLQQGHNKAVDWWCLGLLMHEMMSARHPFQGPSHFDTLRNMVSREPLFDPRIPRDAEKTIRGFLIKDPSRRLGLNGIDEIKVSKFFQNLNFDDIYNKNIDVPYVPNILSDSDTSNFEKIFTNESATDSVVASTPQNKKGILDIISFNFGNKKSKNTTSTSVKDTQFTGFSFVDPSAMNNN